MKRLLLYLLALWVSSGSGIEPFRIEIVDRENSWPVPLVELRTNHDVRFVTDNAGVIAFDLLELMNVETWFFVESHGYEVPEDGFGYRGFRVVPRPGESHRVEVDRTVIAKRIGRLTGAGLFAESQKLGGFTDWLESGVLGCDSVQTAVHDGKLFWLWGDTDLARYPLGIFHSSGATTSLKPLVGLEPPLRLQYDYFRDDNNRPRSIARMPGEGPTWMTGMISLPDRNETPRLVGAYMKVRGFLEAYEWGLAVWNDETEIFERHKIIWTKSDESTERPPVPAGHPVIWSDETGKDWALFGHPFPNLRCAPNLESWEDPDQWELIEPPKEFRDASSGRVIKPHNGVHCGGIAWNEFRQRWIAVFSELGGEPSHLGEIWYAEARSPMGPWGGAVKVLSHHNYTFYNPKLHPNLTTKRSSILLFEGTYTKSFANNAEATSRHDYNQILYRLDLDDPALKPAHVE